MESGVLLESGTNELEILEFKIGENFYGINVAKVREILPYQKPTPIPNAHPFIEGIFMPREDIITLVNLATALHVPENEGGDKIGHMNIVTNFNKLNIAFHVHGVVGIHRVSWEDINKPDKTINASATGILKWDSKLIVILDFERIITDINPETGLKVSDISHLHNGKRNDIPLLIAEDSPLLGKLIKDFLERAGYSNLIMTENGAEAWEVIEDLKNAGTVFEKIKCVITDIEMPQMDGHHLTKLIKSDKELKELPVIIFSSLINPEMRIKGKSVGADAQITKPEIGTLIEVIDGLVNA
ncbi:chemotaxis protein [Anaerocolumna xylanovorans]|uniref:Stage 0 sporulation protein A homolog n=1 Tax=Anaerocolumna xylanovorans DSM 12503 TaxID=1121345 RepID=A0A1M7YCQ1_9FIRM|nr:chemotaxis protein [Anaerocolumna xylanovorans]SHO50383.1 two-component system, chemotaxis family, response regulator CheV [Anaerocolumna xylanovorans DSM 12503]